LIVGLDIRYLTHGLTGGVRNYVHQLATWLPRVSPGVSFVFYGDTKRPPELPADLPPNVRLRLLTWRSPVSSVVNDLAIARAMSRDGVEVAHYPGNYGPPGGYRLVVTVHDALNLFPMREHLRGFGKSPRKIAMMLYLGHKTRRAMLDADLVLTVSEHARNALAQHSGRAADRIRAIHSAADPEFRVLDDRRAVGDAARRWGLRPLTVLADGIKNPAALAAAWSALPAQLRASATLACFARESAPRPELAPLAGDTSFRFVPRPSREELVVLMNAASAFVFPSFYEGFGIPLVEAMRCGLPVVASTRGAIPEVLGGAGLLFDVEDTRALAAHLAAVLSDGAMRARLGRASLARAAAFSWERTARAVVAAYGDASSPRVDS
jgi:glycosyltransferase involved in cell wall biosynthesis